MASIGHDENDFYIADAAARYKSWVESPSRHKPINLDLRQHLSLITNGGSENATSLAMMRSTALPPKKRKREDFSVTDQSSKQDSDMCATTSNSVMATAKAPLPSEYRPLKIKQSESALVSSALVSLGGQAIIDAKPLAFYDREQQVVNTFKSFNCNECGKSFPTHQALGGHKTSHNKRSAGTKEKKLQDPIFTGVHRCKICDRTFPTGQALGGHQRRHYVPPPSPTIATSTLPTSQQNAPIPNIHSFDLNQALELEEEEEYSLELTL